MATPISLREQIAMVRTMIKEQENAHPFHDSEIPGIERRLTALYAVLATLQAVRESTAVYEDSA